MLGEGRDAIEVAGGYIRKHMESARELSAAA
jgi:hypothetical protein